MKALINKIFKRNTNHSKNTYLFLKAHRKLTILFTGVSGLILVAMSCFYLYMSEHELRQSSFLSFLNESNTVIANFEHNDTISYGWLSKISSNNHFILAIYDNGIPLNYTDETLPQKEKAAAATVLSIAQKYFNQQADNNYTALHKNFLYAAEYHTKYYCNVAKIGNPNAPFYTVILYFPEDLNRQIFHQRIRFVLVDIIGIVCLFLFSNYYTKKLLQPLLENQKQQNEFIAMTSHELRTPLAVILSSTSAFQNATFEQQQGLINIIDSEGKQMSHLVNDMLLLTKTNNHTLTYSMEKSELDTLLLNCYESSLPIARKKNIHMQIHFPDTGISSCILDDKRISQVIDILLSNAISYTRENGVIKLSLSQNLAFFEISVIDNGIGISDDAKPHIFERFYREDKSHSEKDHFGLGLCIAKDIIDAHNGTITVKDTPGGGTTMVVKLPK